MFYDTISNVERLQFIGNRLMVKSLKLVIGAIPIRSPKLLAGEDAINSLARTIAGESVGKILIVTSPGIAKRGQADALVRALELQRITPVVFDRILPDPGWEIVNAGLELLQLEDCDGIVALGGGSAIDVAKVIALAAANRCEPARLAGYFKGRRGPLPLFAVPTTAGSGSEATIASVISDDRTHAKSFVVDSRTVPLAVALEPRLLTGLSPGMTAATGMDALTHAIEAFIGTISTAETDRFAGEAVKLIFEYLPRAYKDSNDLEAREAMLIASHKAGRAFTQASVGYVHAISHQLGAYYGLPHGLGNAIVLPQVLAFSRKAARERLARLALLARLGDGSESSDSLAQKFVARVEDLNLELGIPKTVPGLQEDDIPGIAAGAVREALLNYPVPKQMGRADCEHLLRRLLPSREPAADAGSVRGMSRAA